MPTHDIQKVIFDKSYIKFTQMRQKAQENIAIQNTTGYVQNVTQTIGGETIDGKP